MGEPGVDGLLFGLGAHIDVSIMGRPARLYAGLEAQKENRRSPAPSKFYKNERRSYKFFISDFF